METIGKKKWCCLFCWLSQRRWQNFHAWLAKGEVVIKGLILSGFGGFVFVFFWQVVKAFIVLSPSYSSQDPKKLTQELQEHVKRVTAPYKYPRKVNIRGSRTWWAEKSPEHTLHLLSVRAKPRVWGVWVMKVQITELLLQPSLPVSSLGPPQTSLFLL